MTEYVYLYRGYEPPASPEEMQKKTARWMTWDALFSKMAVLYRYNPSDHQN